MEIGSTSKVGECFLYKSNAFINVAEGAVRSGKTIMASFRFLTHVFSTNYDKFLLCGKTRDTIERNVVHDMISMLDEFEGFKVQYNKIDGKLIIEDKIIYILGLNTETVDEKIKGMTVAGVYIDEVTTVPRSAFEMILTRCSVEGAKVFCTTNPDSPNHWFFTEYLSNSKLRDEGYIRSWKFRLEDNPHLNSEYIEQMKSIYSSSSVMYRRNILGEWVSAEGVIYDKFDSDVHLIPEVPSENRGLKLNIGCDYGMSAPTCFVATLQSYDDEGRKVFYVVDTEYHDPAGFNQHSDREKCEDLERLFDRVDREYDFDKGKIFIPHDARSLIQEINKFSSIRIRAVSYRPDTLKCIANLQKLFSDDRLFIVDNENNRRLVQDLQNYMWDPRKQEQGVDAPLKLNDHSVDALRLSVVPVNSLKRRVKVN